MNLQYYVPPVAKALVPQFPILGNVCLQCNLVREFKLLEMPFDE